MTGNCLFCVCIVLIYKNKLPLNFNSLTKFGLNIEIEITFFVIISYDYSEDVHCAWFLYDLEHTIAIKFQS